MTLINTKVFKLKVGSSIIDFNLKGVCDDMHTLNDFKDKDVLVIVFTCNHCPYAQAYESRLIALQDEFKDKVQFIAINSNDAENYPDDSFENMKKRHKEHGWNFSYLFDETQEVAKAYGALCTPHCFVFDKNRKLIYNGGIDDSWEKPEEVTKHYLHDALKAITSGEKVSEEYGFAIGCSVKWKQ